MKNLEPTPDVLRLLDALQYWPKARQFTWKRNIGGASSANRPAGCLVGNQCYIHFLGKRYRTDQLASLVESNPELTASP